MKITCERPKLCEIVSNVSHAVSAKSTLSVLEGILITAKDGKVSFLGYDLEMGIFAQIPAKVKEEGEIVLSARLFVDIVRKMDGEDVSIESDKNFLTKIEGGNSQFTILGIPPEDFPEIPVVQEERSVHLPQYLLKSMINQTLFAVSTNDSKPVHTGSLFLLEDGQLQMVSVDGFRLALRKEKVSSSEKARFVVPGKTLNEMEKLLSEEKDDEACISLSQKHACVQIGEYKVISRLLEGEFLDYKAAIPPSSTTDVTVEVRPLMESISRTSLLISDRLKSPLRLLFEDNTIKMSCSTSMGKAYDQLDCQLTGKDLEIGFNNRYLLDALRVIDCDKVKLLLNGPLAPMKIVPVDGDNFLFLILPVRLKSDIA